MSFDQQDWKDTCLTIWQILIPSQKHSVTRAISASQHERALGYPLDLGQLAGQNPPANERRTIKNRVHVRTCTKKISTDNPAFLNNVVEMSYRIIVMYTTPDRISEVIQPDTVIIDVQIQ